MAFPAGVITRPVTFGPAFELEDGDVAGMTVAFKATRPGVLWMETGSPAVSVAITRNANDGVEQTVWLPVTDQAGWGDGDGNEIVPGEDGHVFLYSVSIVFTQDGRTIPGAQPRSKTIAIPTGDLSPLDLDKIIPLTSPGGTVVSVPDIWSGQVAAAEAAALAAQAAVIDSAEFVGGELADPASPAREVLDPLLTAKQLAGLTLPGDQRDAADARVRTVGDARFARPMSNLSVSLGDSTVAYNGIGSPSAMGDNWFNQLCALSNGRILNGGKFATGGFTIEQVRDTHLPQVLALNPRPGSAFVLVGHNNSKSNTANLNAAKAAYIDIMNGLRAAGIEPIIVLNIAQAYSVQFNTWLINYAAKNKIALADGHSTTASPTTLGVSTTNTVDTIHPRSDGYRGMAQKMIADGILDLFPPRPLLTIRTIADPTDMLGGKGVFGTDINADGIDDRWAPITGGGTQTLSLVPKAPTDGIIGSWQQIAKTNANSAVDGGLRLGTANRITTGYSIGDVIEVIGKFRSSGFEANLPANGDWAAGGVLPLRSTISYTIRAVQSGSATTPYAYACNAWRSDIIDPATFRIRWALDAAAAYLDLEARVSSPAGITGTAQLGIADISFRNLTTGQMLLDAA